MRNERSKDDPAARLRVIQTIAFALIVGLVSFATIAAILAGRPAPAPASSLPTDVLRFVAVLLGLGAGAVGLLTRSPRSGLLHDLQAGAPDIDRTEADRRLFERFVAIRISGLAISEGFGMMGCVLTVLTRTHWDLLFAGIAGALMILQFPSRRSWESFADAARNSRREQ